MLTIRCRPRPPLVAVDRAEVAVVVGPFIPDRDAVFFQISDIGRALQKPDQLMNNRLQMQLLGGHHREAFLQIETHLVTKYRSRTGTGTISFIGAMCENMAHEVKILMHDLLMLFSVYFTV